MNPTYPDSSELERVLREVWTQADATVRKFQLTYDPALAEEVSGGWIVPVASGVAPVNAYELSLAMDQVQQALDRGLEQHSYPNAFVSLFLKPEINQQLRRSG